MLVSISSSRRSGSNHRTNQLTAFGRESNIALRELSQPEPTVILVIALSALYLSWHPEKFNAFSAL